MSPISRRSALLSTLFGTGYLGLRALATGLPVSFLLNPRQALADSLDPVCASPEKAQYVIFSTSGTGDPINANVPGTYDDAKIVHSADPAMAPRTLSLRGRSVLAAAPWGALPQNVLDRTLFWHLMTNTPVHPKEPDVLKLMGGTPNAEMFPSLLAKQLAPCLGTIQPQPISVGALTPAEGLTFGGAALPIVPPLALRTTLTNPSGPLTVLQPLRDATLNQLSDLYKTQASSAQKRYIDSLVTSQQQLRNINQDLLSALYGINDNSATSQILAAITLIRMNVSPVLSIHIPFGGDNHRDIGLAGETAETVAGTKTIAFLMQQLASAGLADKVTFMSLNVFGRTLGPGNTDGRQHNGNHQVSIAIGKPFLGGVIGGVAPLGDDYGARAIDSQTGEAGGKGDVQAIDTLASFGQTMLAAVGVSSASASGSIASPSGTAKVIAGALA